MKTFSFLLTVLLLMAGATVKSQNPIPSWNTAVYYVANFQETGSKKLNMKNSKGRRTLNVKAKGCEGQPSCQVTVWIYSIDLQDIFGPYTISCEEILSTEIDEREWGVVVESEDHVYIDVWIDEEEPLKSGCTGMKPEGTSTYHAQSEMDYSMLVSSVYLLKE